MFKPTYSCLSALSKRTKRVKVQLLKDFPIFQLYKGEVTQVKPSFMRNYLHNYNGARYIMQEADIDVALLQGFQARQEELKTVKKEAKAVKLQVDEAPLSEKQPKPVMAEKKPKGILEKEITVKDVKIPGLDL
ncbi:related to 54S ribosomal protein L50, mitochondrial [Zygosaccharomyces bailii]|nr:related to 54S ribosomal protein L50, mitochondrial [Zygosaccharomyces bailii]